MGFTSVVCASATRVTWAAGASVAQTLPGASGEASTTPAADRPTPQPSAAAVGPARAASASATNGRTLKRWVFGLCVGEGWFRLGLG